MNNNDYKEALFYAASIFNERLGTEFGVDNLVLRCFQTENQQEVFEQFCKQYFPDRLEDRYTEDGYFDFHASAFIGKEIGEDRRTQQIERDGAFPHSVTVLSVVENRYSVTVLGKIDPSVSGDFESSLLEIVVDGRRSFDVTAREIVSRHACKHIQRQIGPEHRSSHVPVDRVEEIHSS